MKHYIEQICRNKTTGAITSQWFVRNDETLAWAPVAFAELPKCVLEQCMASATCCDGDGGAVANYGQIEWDTYTTTDTGTVDAGACYVCIKNAGYTNNAASGTGTIYVNGKPVEIGSQLILNAEYDPICKSYKKVPKLNITSPDGSEAWITEQR